MIKTVVIADDHPIVLSGLMGLIDADPRFKVAAKAVDGYGALEAIRLHIPTLAVLDQNMPGLSGVQTLAAVAREKLETACVILAATASDAEIYDSISLGAAAVILKEAAPDALMECLASVTDGGTWLPDELIAQAIRRETERRAKWNNLAPSLTTREHQIVKLIVAGLPTKEIAFRLNVSDGTMKVHTNNVFRKLQVFSRPELVRLAFGLIADEELV